MQQSDSSLQELSTSDLALTGTSPYDYGSPAASASWRLPQQERSQADLFRYRVVKRLIDLLLLVLISPLLLPLLFVLAMAVRVTSPGPILFSHRRIGLGGRFFSMWKFRTMCVNSSEVLERYLSANPQARKEWNNTHKLKYDPRVTRIGRVLRRLSLDELPQAWNVIAGQMSLVGPRPIVAAEVEKYGKCFRCYASMKPGVTGLWQVSGRSTLSYEARVKLDCHYARNWTLWKDARILVSTLRSVVNQEGAY